MKNTTRKHIWPVSLMMTFAVIGILAAFVALAALPQVTDAQGPPNPFGGNGGAGNGGGGNGDGGNGGNGGGGNGDGGPSNPFPDGDSAMPTPEPIPDDVTSSSTSASAGVKLTLDIGSLPMSATAGSSVVLYLEDDYAVPGTIDPGTVYFTVNNRSDANVNGGGRVYAADPIEISDDDHFGGDDDWDIQVFIPDMNDAEDSGYNGPDAGDSITLTFAKAAGIKNPSEAHDSNNTYASGYKASYAVLGPNDSVPDAPAAHTVDDLIVKAKISLSDEDNSRGYELVVTGSGFNNGTSAGVYVKNDPHLRFSTAQYWETLNCAQMKRAVGSDQNRYCFHYTLNNSDMTYSVNPGGSHPDFQALSEEQQQALARGVIDRLQCRVLFEQGTLVGTSVVGSDDKAAVAIEVTVPTFMAGNDNYICMVDGEGRAAFDDVEQFKLEPSIRVVPTTVAAGDLVNVFAQDFPTSGAPFESITLANQPVNDDTGTSIGNDHSGSASFVVPGGYKGTLRVDASWGGTKEDAKITIAPSALTLSKDEVSANESITLRGSGFGDGAGCLISATISGADLLLISDDDPSAPSTLGAGESCINVEVSSGGQFAATVAIWSENGNNPALTPGTHEISVKDDEGFTATANIVIKEPTFSVTPDVAGPRDYITISGENWPVENDDGGNIGEVEISVGDDDEDADPDASGRWSITHRVAGDIIIPSTIQVKATYGDSNEIVKVGTFSVPQANLTIEPTRAVPGETITLSANGFSLFESDIEVKIGSLVVSVPDSAHTDGDGSIDGLTVLVPSLDPALYTVQLKVDETVTIGELTVMDDTAVGVPQPLPSSTSEVDDNLEAVFYFNDATKSWQVFDPRPEWSDLNTLTELVSGQAYWILVKETQEDVLLNGRLRSLTCSGDNCWNLEVW